jgi:hypothetical protein
MHYFNAIKQNKKLSDILEMIKLNQAILQIRQDEYNEAMAMGSDSERWTKLPWFEQRRDKAEIEFKKEVYSRLLTYYNNQLTKLTPLT